MIFIIDFFHFQTLPIIFPTQHQIGHKVLAREAGEDHLAISVVSHPEEAQEEAVISSLEVSHPEEVQEEAEEVLLQEVIYSLDLVLVIWHSMVKI